MAKLALIGDDGTVEASIELPADYLSFQIERHGGDKESDATTRKLRALQTWSGRLGVDNYRNRNSEYWRYHMERAGLTEEEIAETELRRLETAPDKVE